MSCCCPEEDECGVDAFCCFCFARERTCFKPHSCAEMFGQLSSDYYGLCCMRVNSSNCICPGHPAYDGLKDGRDDVICVLTQYYTMCVKPNFVTGDEPCLKSTSKFCCFTSRCAMPKDDDAPGRCSVCCFVYYPCCGPDTSCCCPTVARLSGEAFGNGDYDVNYMKVGKDHEQYLCCACPLPACSTCGCYIPEKSLEALGQESKFSLCCLEWEKTLETLPETTKDGPEYEEIYLRELGSVKCIIPRTLFKCYSRYMCCVSSGAFPCDDEVPCALACCGKVCYASKTNFKSCYCGCSIKKREDSVVEMKGGAPEISVRDATPEFMREFPMQEFSAKTTQPGEQETFIE